MSNLKYITCGYEDCANGHSWGPAIQRNHVLQYIVKGKGFYEVRGKRYHLSVGQSFYIIPGEITHYYPDMSDPWIYRWITFGGADADDILGFTSLSSTPVLPSLPLEDIFSALTPDVSTPYARLKNESYLLSLLSYLAKTVPSQSAQSHTDYIRIAKRYVSANLQRPDFTVSELARTVGLERTYLFRIFKEGEGISVKEYIINKRLEAARDMFREGVRQVNVVASSCGYDDPLYFSNAFKKKYKLSPREYINKCKSQVDFL